MKKSLLLLMLMAFLLPWALNAQTTLTVNDGTNANNYVPIYGLYADEGVKCEYVIPAALLEDMNGGTISAMKLYLQKASYGAGTITPSFTIFMKEVDATTMTAFTGATDATTVYNNTISITTSTTEDKEVEITFEDGYVYGGGNLLIGFYQNGTSSYKSTAWYGESQTYNSAWSGYGSSSNASGSAKGFLPKTTFTYTPGAAPTCDKPTSITVSAITDNSATISWESEGSAFNLRYKASDDADFTLVENVTSPYSLTNLDGNKSYSVGVQNVCSSSTSSFKSTSFETENPCAAPKNLVVSNITASSATLSWTAGYQEAAWTVKYKKSSATEWTESPVTVPTIDLSSLEGLTQYNVQIINCSEDANSKLEGSFFTGASFPFNEAFNASSIPTGWAQYTGLLSDVMSGTALTSTTYAWAFGSNNGVFDSHARVNIYGNYQKWLVTPAIPMQAGAQLTFDLALTKYSGSLQAVEPGEQVDDKFVVLASTDNGATWQALRQWDNAGSQDVYDDIACSATGQSIKINLEDYSSGNLMIAFYGESTVSGGDNNLHIDNVSVDLVPDCAKPTGLSASEITKHSAKVSWTENGEAGSWKVAYKVDDESVTEFTEVDATINPYPLTGLLADTTYIVKVRANCGGGSLSDYSAEISVSTPIACIAPLLTNSGITDVSAHSAQIAWAGDPEAAGFTVSYRTAEYVDGLEEQFNNSGIPSGWARYSGLVDNVIAGTATLTTTTSGWGSNSYAFGAYNMAINVWGTSCKYWLVTPEINLASGSALNFDLALTDYNNSDPIEDPTAQADDRFVVLVFADGAWTILREWNNSGSSYAYNGIATTGEKVNIDLSAYNGKNIKIAFYGESTVGSNGDNDLHIDNVQIGVAHPAGSWNNIAVAAAENPQTVLTDLAAETNYEVKVKGDCGEDGESLESAIRSFTTGIACPTPTALLVSEIAPHQAKLSWTENGEVTAWEIAYKLASDADFGTPIAVSDTPHVLANLEEVTAYVVKVRANCGSEDGMSEWSEAVNFTTLAGCPVPTSVAADNIKGHSATISWTGNQLNAGYVLSYRTAAFMDGIEEHFDASGIPTGWARYTGLVDDVLKGSASLNTTTSGWSTTTYGLGSYNAKLNIYGSSCKYWLVTPEVNLASGSTLTFDLALTAYNSNSAASGTCEDDRFVVLVFADDAWAILREWNNSGSTYVYNNIATTGENVSIDLSAFAGKIIKIAFYGESIVNNNGDNDLHIDNVVIGVPVAAGAWTEVNNISAAEYSLSNLAAETKYEVVVQGLCAGNVVSDSSEIVSFTTAEACMVPSALQVSEISNVSAKLSWIENGDAAAWIVAYKLASAEAFTEVDVLPADTPYIFSNLEAGKEYIVKVRANCGNEDGQSEWTTTKSFSTELCAPDDQCLLTFELTDSYGDSWNGNAILVTDVLTGKVLGEMANENLNGTSGSNENEVNIKTLSVCNGREIQFSWVTGSYPDETSYVVKDVNGHEIFSGSGAMSAPVNYTVDCRPSFNLEINATGYATFYDADNAYLMPDGLTGHAFSIANHLSNAIYGSESGQIEILPADEPVVMKAADGISLPHTFELIPAISSAAHADNNDLHGVNEATIIGSASDGKAYYVLSMNGSNDPESVGFYYMLEDGKGGFELPAHKAYLVVDNPSLAPSAFFLIDENQNATWLENLQGVEGTVKFMHEGNIYILRDSIIYDATGRKVRELK